MNTNKSKVLKGVFLGLICVGNVYGGEAAPSRKVPAKIVPPSISLVDAAIIWNRTNGAEVAPAEFQLLHERELFFTNEFDKIKKNKEALINHKAEEALLLKISTFSLSVTLKLDDYNFEGAYFPTNLTAGRLGIQIGSIETSEKDAIEAFTDENLVSLRIKYLATLDVPEELTKVNISQTKAEKLLDQAQDREIVGVLHAVLSGKANQPKVAVEYSRGEMTREIPMTLIHAELKLPDTTKLKNGKFIAVPGEVVKVWNMPPAEAFEKAGKIETGKI